MSEAGGVQRATRFWAAFSEWTEFDTPVFEPTRSANLELTIS